MLEIAEFRKKRSYIFKHREDFQDISFIRENLENIKIISANERSIEIIEFLEFILHEIEEEAEDNLLFAIYWMYFIQTYLYEDRIDNTRAILAKMSNIEERNKDFEQKAIVLDAEALLLQLEGKHSESFEKIKQAKDILEPHKHDFPETFYAILYAYTYFRSFEDLEHRKASKTMKKCFDYYYKISNNSLGMSKSLSSLLRFYTFARKRRKADKLLDWTFKKEKIPDRISNTQAILLYLFAGTISAFRYKIEDALIYLEQVYNRIKDNKLQNEMMYEFSSALRLLSRFYAFQGNFPKSYELITELAAFIREDFIKRNFNEKNKKKLYFSSYYTLIFIYSQLDLDIENVQDKELRNLYHYINNELSKTKIPSDILEKEDYDQNKLNGLLQDEKTKDEEDISFVLHHIISKHESYLTPEDFEDKIYSLRDYVYNQYYLDILLAKIYLSKGNFEKFQQIIKKLETPSSEEQDPTIIIWKEVFSLLLEYIKKPSKKNIQSELNKLIERCKKNNYRRMVEEISLYHKLISSKRTVDNVQEKFKQTAFMDVFSDESKSMLFDFLDLE